MQTNSVYARQEYLHNLCYHPTGIEQPLDWRNPNKSITEYISVITEKYPDRLAAFDHELTLTYAELEKRINQIANLILAASGHRLEAVGLLSGVDITTVIAALGIIKAGKFYVAVEETFPQERMMTIFDDTDVQLIISDEINFSKAKVLAGDRRQLINLNNLQEKNFKDPEIHNAIDSPALINYTSGSTGKPKGVVQSHYSAIAQSLRFMKFGHLSDADRVASFNSLSWAGPFWKFIGPLILGASTGFFDIRRYGLTALEQWLCESKVTMVTGLPVVRQIIHSDSQLTFPLVRLVRLGGDIIYRQDVKAVKKVFPNTLICVGLGISEAGRVTNFLLDGSEELDQEILHLGLPVEGVEIQLVSEDGAVVKPGEVGEMVILSDHLAQGYWQRPKLTAQKFKSSGSFGDKPCYLTGDLGKRLENGMLQHKGRKDFSVKIRGYQVFTNEIEALLLQVSGIQEACIVARKSPDGIDRLIAYLVVDNSVFSGITSVYSRLKNVPDYMKPQGFVFLDHIPRTSTGKFDRLRLPTPKASRLLVSAEYSPPTNKTEETLAEIWEGIIGIPGIGVHDNFLELGGDSLQSIRIINKVTDIFQIKISVNEFFNTLTIAEMALLIPDKT